MPKTPQPRRNRGFNRTSTYHEYSGNKAPNFASQLNYKPDDKYVPKNKIGLDKDFEKELELIEMSFKGSRNNSRSPSRGGRSGSRN